VRPRKLARAGRPPLAAAALASAALLVAFLLAARALGASAAISNGLSVPVIVVAFAVCYALGASAALWPGLAAALACGAAMQYAGGSFSPVIWMVTAGPWLAGRAVASRRALIARLAERNAELAREQDLFARESVRYERARIARDLHDIVAHSLSAMVVQATAAQRLADAGPGRVTEAMRAVATAAAEAEADIGRLVELLDADPVGDEARPAISELVQRAAATGLDVSCRLSGSLDGLGHAASQAAYRVVQESLTNALKHAPGAPVAVEIGAGAAASAVVITATRGPARQVPSGLAGAGAGYGLAAMRERVTACGGSLAAGPTADGGWQVRAVLPAGSDR
jgi:signal transduction histidine kinase